MSRSPLGLAVALEESGKVIKPFLRPFFTHASGPERHCSTHTDTNFSGVPFVLGFVYETVSSLARHAFSHTNSNLRSFSSHPQLAL